MSKTPLQEAFGNVMKSMRKGVKLLPYAKPLEDNRKEIYRVSRLLDEDEGYKLLNTFESALKNKEDLIKNRDEINQKDD